MKPAPNLVANVDGCIPEKNILKSVPEELLPLWENYMRGKTVQECGFDDWGVYEYDYKTFQQHVLGLVIKHMEENPNEIEVFELENRSKALDELTAQAQDLKMGY